MKRVFLVAGGAMVAIALATAGFLWWEFRPTPGPALADGMWWNRDCCNVDSAYDARLREMFVGRDEGSLRHVLVRQGFEFRGPRSAEAHWSDFACGYFAGVDWTVDDAGRVNTIRGDVGSACV
jgi:hypothetical protein